MERFLGRYSGHVYAVMRVVIGFLFWFHGAQKLFGWFGGFGPDGGSAELVSRFGVAGIIEFFGGLLIALGVYTSVVAFIASGEMAVAYFVAHFPQAFWPIQNGGERAVLFSFVFLYIAARGSGMCSLFPGSKSSVGGGTTAPPDGVTSASRT